MSMGQAASGCHIVMTGLAGAAGTHTAADAHPDILAERFSPAYTDRIRNIPVTSSDCLSEIISITEKTDTDSRCVIRAGRGGIYAALWDLGEEFHCGLRARHKDIPMCQETIEVCNLLDLNPYMIDSTGSLLIVCDEPASLIDRLAERGIDAADIGCLTSESKRVIINGESERFLNSNRGNDNG